VTGTWATPIKRDPFTVTLAEKIEVMFSLNEVPGRLDSRADASAFMVLFHRKQEKTFASTDGSFITQTRYVSHPHMQVFASDIRGNGAARTFDMLQPSAVGWEKMTDASLADAIPAAVEEAVRKLDAERVTPDRYDVVLDALAMAQLVAMTIGVAAELDRVMGYEANAGGTSYLAPPDEMLGKFAVAPRMLNVTANRTQPGAIGTVKWDDEGVVPSSYPIIKDGVLANYHTNREMAAVQGTKSTGSAASDNAGQFTILQPPNIEMLPGDQDLTLDDLVAQLDHGLVVLGGAPSPGSHGIVSLDRQQLNGEMTGGTVYEVRKGKRTGYIRNAELLFRSPDLWKTLKAIGGKRSQVWTASTIGKGQPNQQLTFGSAGVPAMFTKAAVTDVTRRA
jgi:TldD protein